ncbi:MAG: SpoIIE family protein phosphatase [Candidatus Magnetomorum sp.]|nr:SpoIIE family protein phosphatase [Candidatus Magnetomorum sp.]
MRLRQEILIGAIGISVFIIIVSMTAVIHVIQQQNDTLSFDKLKQSFHIIFDDISARQKNILAATRQLSKVPKMGLTIQYLVNYGKYEIGNVSLRSTYQKMALQAKEIAQAAGIWQLAIYDGEGDLMAFSTRTKEGYRVGYAEGFPTPVFQIGSVAMKEMIWTQQANVANINLTLDKATPQMEHIQFERVDHFLCMVAYVPIQRIQWRETNTIKISGTARAIFPLDQSIVTRLSALTDTQINILTQNQFSTGMLPEYDSFLHSTKTHRSRNDIQGDPRLTFSEITLHQKDYYQAAYHLQNNHEPVGTILSLYSKKIARKNTFQMIHTLGMIALICIGIIIPLAFFFSNTISKPIRQMVMLLRDGITNGDFKKDIHIRQTGEIGELVSAFQVMKATIRKVSKELIFLTENIQQGKLDFRANNSLFFGEWRDLINGVNNVVSAFVEPIDLTSKMLDCLASGELPEKIHQYYKGDFNKIIHNLNALIDVTHVTTQIAEEIVEGNLSITIRKRSGKDRMITALNEMIQKLNEIIHETNTMIHAVEKGHLDIRGNVENFDGGWRDMMTGINQLIDGLRTAVSKSAKLSQEMALARKIQTSLQPSLSDDMHPELIVSATMLPADQVGGDFYDVAFDQSGNIGFAIGDVSGHGVAAGMIMMMAQTIYSTVTTNHTHDARTIVITINRILYSNVCQRLNESHFMTFTVLKYLGEGSFQHAGAHLSMIIFRKKTQKFDLIRTTGVYLNLKSDISHATKNNEFYMDCGDILFLYTDGITEAENQEGNILDIDGFIKIARIHIHRNPEDMKEKIMCDVLTWCKNNRTDDMTMLIIKRREKHNE